MIVHLMGTASRDGTAGAVLAHLNETIPVACIVRSGELVVLACGRDVSRPSVDMWRIPSGDLLNSAPSRFSFTARTYRASYSQGRLGNMRVFIENGTDQAVARAAAARLFGLPIEVMEVVDG